MGKFLHKMQKWDFPIIILVGIFSMILIAVIHMDDRKDGYKRQGYIYLTFLAGVVLYMSKMSFEDINKK